MLRCNFCLTTAVTWLKYCRYGVKLYPINQSFYWTILQPYKPKIEKRYSILLPHSCYCSRSQNKLVNYNEGFIFIPTVLIKNLVIVDKLLIFMSLPVSDIYLPKDESRSTIRTLVYGSTGNFVGIAGSSLFSHQPV